MPGWGSTPNSPFRPLHAFPNDPPSRLRSYETEDEEGVYVIRQTGRSDESIVWGMECVVASV